MHSSLLTTLWLFFLSTSVVECTLWRDSSISEMRMLRECFHIEHAEQIAYLFPGASHERDRREARALDDLGRLLKSGTSFCDAYDQITSNALHYIENELAQARANSNSVIEERWYWTMTQFKQRREETHRGCRRVESNMTQEERARYTGILSPLNKCIDRIQLISVKALIKSQFKAEEEAF